MPGPLTILVGAAAVAAWARRGGLRHVVVTGGSMRPTLRSGDRLLLVGVPGTPRIGQLALADDPRAPGRRLLKRVHAVDAHGVDLRGDDPAASTDSRVFGRVPRGAVRGYVAWRYAPAGRAGWVPAAPVSGSRARGGRPRSR